MKKINLKVENILLKRTFGRRIKRIIRFWWQRRTRGWDDSETWDLDAQLAAWLVPRLRRFKEINNSYPGHISAEEWDNILDEMIEGFSLYEHEVDSNKISRSWRLLGENGNYLWW